MSKRDSANPLIVRCGALGDMVLITTLIRLLAQRYRRPVDLLTSGGWTTPLLDRQPFVGHVQVISSRRTPYWLCPSQWRAVRWLRARGAGPVYLCDSTPEIRALLRRAGVGEETIVDAYDPKRPVSPGKLWPDRWLEVGQRDPVRPWPTVSVDDPAIWRLPTLTVPSGAREDADAWLREHGWDVRPLVLFQAGNKRTHKRGRVATRQHNKHWPPGRWAALARAVLDDLPDAQVLLCGSPAEHGVIEDIRRYVGDARVSNIADALPIPRLMALLERAHSLVSVDSGPAHMAAAVGCPLVVLFGAAPRAMWQPIGRGPIVSLGGEQAGGRVDDITADAVIAAWRSLPTAPATSDA
jgi:ADP-heptose:LPS heptosyltransferase